MTSPITGIVSGLRRDLELQWARDEERELELTAAERYARDPLAWLNDFAVIASKFADRRERAGVYMGGKVRPAKLTLWPNQEETLAAWIDLERLASTGELTFRNVLIEKSRQEGETWVLAGAVDWLLQYHEVSGLYLHQRAAEVADRGWTIKSFFGRVKYVDDRLDRRRVPDLAQLRFMPFSKDPAMIQNSRTGSLVYGEVQRDDPGRGQSLDFSIVDEAAHVQHGEHVHSALDEACKAGKVYLSTPMGDDNVHARLCDEKPAGYTYLRLHWSEHPIYSEGLHVAGEDPDCAQCEGTRQGVRWNPSEPKAHRYPGKLTSPWYEQAVLGKTDEQVARELDIDRAGALTGRVYAEFSREVHVEPDGIAYEEALHAKLELGWDFGLDCTAIVVCQDAPADYRVIGYLRRGDLFRTTATPEAVAEALVEYLRELGVPERLLTKNWLLKIHAVGDPSGHSRSAESGLPFVNAYRRLGFKIGRPAWRYCRSVELGISSVKRLLLGQPKPLRVCGVNAVDFADDLANNRWPTDATGARRISATRPLDDLHNHGADAFRYLVVSKWPPPKADAEDFVPAPELPEEGDGSGHVFRTRAERFGKKRPRDGVISKGMREGMSL